VDGVEHGPEFPPGHGIHAGGGLVQEHEPGAGEERGAKGELLFHAPRQRPGKAVPEPVQVHGREERGDAGTGVAQAVEAGLELQVLQDREIRRQAEDLGHVAEALPVRDQVDAPGGGALEAHEHAESGGLAGAVGADEAHQVAFVQDQVHAVHGLLPAGEAAGETGGFQEAAHGHLARGVKRTSTATPGRRPLSQPWARFTLAG